jgi:predicted acylesterase/phospholipase RssA
VSGTGGGVGSARAADNAAVFQILSLDGGGAKGFYTLGVLHELEALLGGTPLYTHFNLIYGTSTGAIIAALIALGKDVATIHSHYQTHVPDVMGQGSAASKASALKRLAEQVFEEATFEDFKTPIGIVATRWDFERPMIFKQLKEQAHGRQSSFVAGFGCTVAEAVRASCSAYPFFDRPLLKTGKEDRVDVFDGGFSANNPTLYAIADAVAAFKVAPADVRVLSVGVGTYPEPKKSLKERLRSWAGQVFVDPALVQRILNVNTTSMEHLARALFPTIQTVRINETFQKPEMATDFLESDLGKLNILFQRGKDSFASHEAALRSLLDIG